MPAGRMYLPAKKVQRRRYKRSRFAKAVSTIARKTVKRIAETKTANQTLYTSAQTFGINGLFFSVNGGGCLAGITQGSAQNNRVGDRIQTLGVKFRGLVNVDSTVFTTAAQQALTGYRLLICTTKRGPLTSGDMPSYQGAIDPDVLTVLHDGYYKMTNNCLMNQVNKYIKFRRNTNYSGLVPIKNDIYFWLTPAPIGPVTTTTGYGVRMDAQIYFKDI